MGEKIKHIEQWLKKNKVGERILPLIGVIGVVYMLAMFAIRPHTIRQFNLMLLLLFGLLLLSKADESFKKIAPFLLLLLVYESFRNFADQLGRSVEYIWMIKADTWLFGSLPTATLQRWFWNGSVQWYDSIFYICYALHFAWPLVLAFFIAKYRTRLYWWYVSALVAVSAAGFITFAIFPAAPPWLASEKGYINPPIAHIASETSAKLGAPNHKKLSPNPVAAVPSLHAAYATILVMFVFVAFGKKWGAATSIYPLIIYVGTVYSGHHYAIDEIIGILYGVCAFFITRYIFQRHQKLPVEPTEH